MTIAHIIIKNIYGHPRIKPKALCGRELEEYEEDRKAELCVVCNELLDVIDRLEVEKVVEI